jgi:hypothetical protein
MSVEATAKAKSLEALAMLGGLGQKVVATATTVTETTGVGASNGAIQPKALLTQRAGPKQELQQSKGAATQS